MNKLFDISYFIKNSNFQKNKEIYPNNNFSKLNSKNLMFKDYTDVNAPFNLFQKIPQSPPHLKTNTKFSTDNYYNSNDFNIKRKLLESSLPISRNNKNKIIQNKSCTVNDEKHVGRNKIDFPLLKSMSNNYIIKGNANNNNSSLMLNINEENNLKKNSDIINNYMNILSIRQLKPKAKNIPKIQIKYIDKNSEDKIKLNDSLKRLGQLFKICNNYSYKNRYLALENQLKLNNNFNTSKSVKSINKEKIEIKNQKQDLKIQFPHINNYSLLKKSSPLSTNTNIEKKEENTETKKNIKIIKHVNTEKIISNSSSPGSKTLPKTRLKKIKIINDIVMKNIFHFERTDKQKSTKIEKINKFIKPFQSLEEVFEKFLSNKEKPYLLNNITNINTPMEQYYYTVNKMYIKQLPEYMKHRINWVLVDQKSLNLDEEKNININFQWKYFSDRLNFKKYKYDPNPRISSKKYCMVNLFERNYQIGNKRNMFKNLISYCDKVNLNVFDFVPFTMIVNYSKDIEPFLQALKDIMDFINMKKGQNEDLITNRKYSEHFWFDKNYNELMNQYIYINKNFLSDKNYWIIKPPDLYQGKCIQISDDFEEINKLIKNMFKGVDKRLVSDSESEDEELYNDNNINNNINSNLHNYMANCDKYNKSKSPLKNNIISNSDSKIEQNLLNKTAEELLINSNNKSKKKDKKKIYSKITCFNEVIVQKYLDNPLLYKKRKFDIRCYVLVDSNLNVFFCREGHLKGSSEFYDINTKNKFIHITNHSLQKKSSKFEQYEYGNEMSYSDFKKFMEEEKIPLEKFNKMIEDMKKLVKISFKSVGNKLLKVTPVLCFEIFGYDFILDSDFRPWILEINNNPGLGISSPVIQKLVPRMFDDALRLTIDKIFNTKYSDECIDENGKYKTKYKLEGFNDDDNIFEFMCNIND